MNAVYMTIVAIIVGIAVAASLQGVLSSQGIAFSVVVYIAALAFKIFLDDIAHFKRTTDSNVIANGFMISVVIWLTFGVALASIASDLERTLYYIIVVNLLGTIWLALNYLGVEEQNAKEKNRRRCWIAINSFHVLAISTFFVFHGNPIEERWDALFYTLSAVVVLDAVFFGTFRRLASAFS